MFPRRKPARRDRRAATLALSSALVACTATSGVVASAGAASAVAGGATNLALPANGGTVSASSSLSGYPASGATDGVRETTSGYWNDNTNGSYPDTLAVSWSAAKQIGRVTLRMPVLGTGFTAGQRTIGQLRVQYLNGSTWTDVTPTNGQANPVVNWVAPTVANGKEVKQFYFAPVSTTSVRVKFDSGNSDGWSFLEELEAYNTTQVLDYDDAVKWLEGEATQLEAGSRVTASDGTRLYTPDGTAAYNALWTRDWEYMLEGRPQGVGAADAKANFKYLINKQRADGAIPDRVDSSGSPYYTVIGSEPPTDNSQFLVKAAYQYYRLTGDITLFNTYKTQLVSAMNAVPKDSANGLVYIDPASPHSPYGFTDTIAKTGDELFSSLLYYEAAQNLSALFAANGDATNASTWATTAASVKTAVQSLRDSTTGMYYAASVGDHQLDVWGSAYAVVLGVASGTQAQNIANWLANNYSGIVQNGQFRHLPPGEFWNTTLNGTLQGTYQNGAYWGTPTGWIAYALSLVNPVLARQTVIDMVDYYKTIGPWEADNADNNYKGVGQYVASATTPLAGIRLLDGPNLALSANGGSSTSSSSMGGWPNTALNDGRVQETSGYWNDNTNNSYPDTAGISWTSSKTIDKVVLRMPVLGTGFTAGQRTIGQLRVQYLNGSTWTDVTPTNGQANPAVNWVVPTTPDGGEARTFRFAPVSTTQIRVKLDSGNSDGWSYLEEIEAYSTGL